MLILFIIKIHNILVIFLLLGENIIEEMIAAYNSLMRGLFDSQFLEVFCS